MILYRKGKVIALKSEDTDVENKRPKSQRRFQRRNRKAPRSAAENGTGSVCFLAFV